MTHLLATIVSIFVPMAHAAENSGSGSTNVAQLLGIDWRLFIAQLVNVGIVIFIFWKWVFGPIGKILSERAEKVAKSMRDAEDIAALHAKAEQERIAKIETARAEAQQIIERAEKSAENAKREIIAEAHSASEKLIEQTKAILKAEKDTLKREVREEAATLVVLATEKILREKLDPKKDQQLIREALKNI